MITQPSLGNASCLSQEKVTFYDLESIIDDWVLLGYLVGNDFIPHLPNIHIHSECLPLLWRTYMQVLPTLDGKLIICSPKILISMAWYAWVFKSSTEGYRHRKPDQQLLVMYLRLWLAHSRGRLFTHFWDRRFALYLKQRQMGASNLSFWRDTGWTVSPTWRVNCLPREQSWNLFGYDRWMDWCEPPTN